MCYLYQWWNTYLHKLVLLAVFMQLAANGIRPATAQHDDTRTLRPTVPSCCAVVRSVLSATQVRVRTLRRLYGIFTTLCTLSTIFSTWHTLLFTATTRRTTDAFDKQHSLSHVLANGHARPIRFENFRIGPSLSNRLESGSRFEFESNLEASQFPNVYGPYHP